MKIGDRVKGIFSGVAYTGKIIDRCGTHSFMYQVQFDEPVEKMKTAVIFQHGDTIEPDKTIENKIRGLNKINMLGQSNERK